MEPTPVAALFIGKPADLVGLDLRRISADSGTEAVVQKLMATCRQIGEELLQGASGQASLPREVTLANSSTIVPRIRWTRSNRFVTTQAWLGITRTRSPTAGRSVQADRSTCPCSSDSPVMTASG